MGRRIAGAAIGVIFGITLCWSGMSSPVVIRQALLFEKSYLFLFFASAVLTATIGLRLLRRRERRALLVDAPLTWPQEPPERRHVVGSLIFGIGWGVADACPGPIATQVGQGIGWALFTLAGVVAGVYLFLRRASVETEPASVAASHARRRPTVRAPVAGSAPPAISASSTARSVGSSPQR
jgi:uncharacterized membrane protein YedE/YeeE